MKQKDIEKLESSVLSEDGKEINNPIPVAISVPTGELPLHRRIKNALENAISQRADEQGQETFEESNDFDVQDSFELPIHKSRYELVHEEYPELPEDIQELIWQRQNNEQGNTQNSPAESGVTDPSEPPKSRE